MHRALATLALLLLVACDRPATGPAPRVTLNILGTVRSGTTGLPIAGAAVEVWDCPGFLCFDRFSLSASATTDDGGRYTLVVSEALPNGGGCIWAAALSVRAEGFVRYDVYNTYLLPIRCDPEPQVLDFDLAPAALE